ncbi:crotonase/enoyl-CoA hydratase family protein [Actinomycetospora cinnamomea]|uniref:Vanillin synthase /trans-feruloyl-CoA hydratase n=1 Tax=Actinomycetospora cinnamomea TaxID=663609 RepID=A0A2U1FI92_9PSEU|nr:crotonase/enoyl-CoA hydratase family protein [Actinomycetospora cinnamomea]PVZ11877.1 vanillin synthase /trans-feruloyl-CoA hydratase [Actinomycetospora cinnamomea]
MSEAVSGDESGDESGGARPDDAVAALLPRSLTLQREGPIAILRLARPAKRNALDDATVLGLEAFFAAPPSDVRAVVLDAEGEHFSAGLDLAELGDTDAVAGVEHSRFWHRVFDRMERGRLPVVSVLKGAVVGGGLELAAATHVRVAESGAFYALPEARHGLFVGGGGSVRIPRLIGVPRMTDMMLTGRVLDADEGQQLGISTYLTEPGGGFPKALELAHRIAANPPTSTFAVLQALPRIAAARDEEGYLMESLMAAISSSSADAQDRMSAFLDGHAGKVR